VTAGPIALVLGLSTLASGADAPPPWVDEAIRAGSTATVLEAYEVPAVPVSFTTPFRRVARAANKAFREGRTLKPAEVDPRAWVPELRVVVGLLPVVDKGRLLGVGDPRSVRLTLGPREIKPSRADHSVTAQTFAVGKGRPQTVKGGMLKAVFVVPGTAPPGGELEIRYVWTHGGRQDERLERVPLDFRATRW
jgi:hypothetical protein